MISEAPTQNPRLERQAAWVVAWRVIGIVITAAANILAVCLLDSPANFGRYLMLTTVIALGSILAMGGMNEAGLRFISESLGLARERLARTYLRRIALVTLGNSAVVALVIAVGLMAFQLVTGDLSDPVAVIAIATAAVVALSWQQVAAEMLRGYGDLRLASVFSGGQTGGPLSNLLFLAALGLANFLTTSLSTSMALGLMAASVWITMPVALFALWKISHAHRARAEVAEPAHLSREQGRQLLAAAGSLLVIQLLTTATYQLDIWIGGALLTANDLGFYGVAKRCQLLGQLPVQMAMMTVVSAVPRMRVQNRIADLEAVVRRAATLAAIPGVCALSVLALFPSLVLHILFGDAYTGAAHVILPLVVGQLAHILFGNPAYVLTMTGHHPLVLRINVLSTLLLVIAGSLGAWLAGPFGLAAGSAASMVVQNGLLWWFSHKRLGIWTHVRWPSRQLGEQVFNSLAATWPQRRRPIETPELAETQERAETQEPAGDESLEEPLEEPVPVAAKVVRPNLLTRLWWLHPGWAFALSVGITIVAAWW
ncbi:MAG TPA: lipopolysaccharide biosynthesis protein, partial [Pirellulales bacterium]|nr:lipopolysaccharide biosynthesis protein [Pirellulales bacterium]